ncbi:uncharacterized protein [Mytilus edulis]
MYTDLWIIISIICVILSANVNSYNHIAVQDSGCADGSRIGLYGHDNIVTCQGQWKGHINNSSHLCAAGWKVCSYEDTDLLGTISWEEAISVEGCYSMNAAQDGGKCQKCAEDYGQDDMAGIGRGCPHQNFGQTSCIRGGRIDSSCCVDSHFQQACHYKPNIHGVVCCKLPSRKPKIVVKPKSKIEVNTGLIFLLTCQATGSPAPRVQWYKDGTQIPVTNNRIQTLPSGDLLVTLAKKSDTGLYSCEVINTEGMDMASSQVIVREYSSGCKDGTTEGLDLHRDVHACSGKWEGHVRKGKSLCKKGWKVCNPTDREVLHGLTWLDMLDLQGCYAYNAAMRKGQCKKCRERNMAGFGRNCGKLRYQRKRQSCLATGRVDVFKKSESSSGCFYKEGVTSGVLCCKRKTRKSKKKPSAVCSSKCLNGGKCMAHNYCQCPSGYKGAVCQIPICRYGCGDFGECIKPGICQCKDGFTGKNCHRKVCKQTCLNGGRCVKHKCRCSSGFDGKHCQRKSTVLSKLNRTER